MRPWMALVVFTVVAGLTVFMSGQQRGRMANPQSSMHVPILTYGPQEEMELHGVPDDWSFHHVNFTDPGTEEDAIRDGRHEQWLSVVDEPRYVIQQLKRRQLLRGPYADLVARMNDLFQNREADAAERLGADRLGGFFSPVKGFRPPRWVKEKIQSDWSEKLGTGGLKAGQYPAKFGFLPTSANCSDYVVYPTGTLGTSSQATIVAYTNLYSGGCSSPVPQVYWAYNVPVSSTNGTATLSPVIDFNGTQVAFVETVSGTSYLVLLRMPSTASSTVTTVTPVANTSYQGCTAPCATTLTLGTTDTNSPPFYDYSNDRMYVGDDGGHLHQITGAFRGSPTQAWSTTVSSHSSTHLTGAVVDPQSYTGDATHSNLIYVCDNSGYLFSVNSSGTVEGTSSQMDFNGGFTDTPLLDSNSTSTSYIYTFGQHSGSGTYINRFTATSGVSSYGTANSFSSNGSSTLAVYDGAFDVGHTTYSNGNLYWCALATSTSSGSSTYPTLWKLAMNTGFSNTATVVAIITNGAATCSPITEFDDNTTDWLFLSVTANGSVIASGSNKCTGACLYNFVAAATTPSDGLAVAGGASGVIVDNNQSGTVAGSSQVYLSTLASQTCATSGGSGSCGIQASQSALAP